MNCFYNIYRISLLIWTEIRNLTNMSDLNISLSNIFCHTTSPRVFYSRTEQQYHLDQRGSVPTPPVQAQKNAEHPYLGTLYFLTYIPTISSTYKSGTVRDQQ